jgi:hypothetical protein
LTGDQNSSSSGSLVLVQNNQRTSSNRIPTTDHAHPTLYIYAGGSTANDYVRINHDTSNATIATGDGSIILDPANSVVVIDGGLTASNLYVTSGSTFDSTIAATSTSNTVDIIASTDGAGLRIAQATSGTSSRTGAIRLGRAPTSAFNTYLENVSGVFTIYNGVGNTGTNLFNINNTQANFGVPIAGVTFSQSVSLSNLTINGSQGSSNQVLTSTGSGITWATPSGGGGGISRSINNISTTTSAGSAANTDYVYNVTSGTFTLTMPTAVSNTNRYTIKQSGTGALTIDTTSSQTIDGGLTYGISPQYAAIDLLSDGSNWFVV